MQLSHRDIKKILQVVDGAASASEIDFVHNGLHFRFTRDKSAMAHQPAVSIASASNSPGFKSNRFGDEKESLVSAPVLGKFYRYPGTNQDLAIDAGMAVCANQTIAVIKTEMGTTAVRARTDGIVKRIFANDGELVEFDQPLFLIAVT